VAEPGRSPELDVERERRVQELFERLVELPPERRGEELDAAADGDGELRRRVARLLEHDRATDGFLEEPLGEPGGWLAAPARRWSGRRLGAYRLGERIGEGGSGVVYAAEREDGVFRQRVAVKLLRPGLGADAERRLRAERRILAQLSHPGIARVLDGGSTGEGVPYLVMEHVDGEPITGWCDRRRLGVRRRVELFRQVCEAVHHAHRNLVVHRDLKPGNVLVTAEGAPKVLDFGIAKLLDPATGAGEAPLTAPHVRVLTPGYASPEQLAGDPITTASDVYSLGVVLRELLAGRHPGPAPGGDLGQVVAKAMAREPEERYASAQQLADDLGRYLEGRPVLARPPRLADRAVKFVRRNRLLAASVAASVAVVTTLLVLLFFETRALERERDLARTALERAERERIRAEAVTRFLRDSFELADPQHARGGTLTARQVLDAALRRIRVDLAAEPELQAELLHTVADLYLRIGDYDAAEALAEESLDRRRRRSGAGSASVAEALTLLAEVLLVERRFDEAEPRAREALRLRRRLPDDDAPGVAENLHQLSAVWQRTGELERAERAAREALAVRRRAFGAGSRSVAESLHRLASVHHARGELEAAEELYRRAVASLRGGEGAPSSQLAVALQSLAALLGERGASGEAEELLREALEIVRGLHGAEHPSLARVLVALGYLHAGEGRWDEAAACHREAVAVYRRSLGDDHLFLSHALVHLGVALRDGGDPASAEAPLREAVAIARRRLDPDDPLLARYLDHLARALLGQGRREEAEALAREGLEHRRRLLDPGDGRITASRELLGEIAREEG